ncbi:MAG: carotenoid 1,2-hydratase, partial [Chloroflexi bacterium HGW-Chloroflexi-8]
LDQWETYDGYVYPIKWSIFIESEDLELTIEPVIKQQENELFFRYWEGAVRVTGFKNGQAISGYGYVEMTGYAQSMKGVF